MNLELRNRHRRTKHAPSLATAHDDASAEIVRELRRCLAVASGAILEANRTLNRADGLIEALWSNIEYRPPSTPVAPAVTELAPTNRLLRAPEVRRISGLSRTTIWRLEQRGGFPRHVQITRGCVGWRVEDVETWVAGRRER
jgi:prophage regulatory protein